MPNRELSVYLNDHLAGSVAGLKLLSELRRFDGFAAWADDVRSEVAADRGVLETLMQQTGIEKSTARQAAGWIAEELAELKTRVDDWTSGGALKRLELIEALALGIDGKRALWTALQVAAEQEPALRGVDYPRLIERAENQRRTVETRRLQAAAEALTGS